jgi:MFS family permease
MRRGRRRRSERESPQVPLSPSLAAILVFCSMLSSTLLIPAVRPFFAAVHPSAEGGLFWFMSVNMLGAIVGAPVLGALADALRARWLVLVAAAVLDGVLLFLCALPLDLPLVLTLRCVQGAANVAAVSLLMGLTTSAGVPVAGGATIAAIAVGAPLGTLLLPLGPQVPLQVGAMLPLVVAVVVGALQPGAPQAARVARGLRSVWSATPAGVFVFAERLAIGLFIVPFSLLCHDVRGFDDAVVGRLYAAFLVPFALATAMWPRLRASPVASVVLGAVVYASALVAAARIGGVLALAAVLVAGGVGAAGVYAPALRSVGRLVPPERVGAAMGLVNALGALGMLIGSGGARFLTQWSSSLGADRATSLALSFDVGAGALVVLVGIGAPLWARHLGRAAAPGVARSSHGSDDDAGDDEDEDEDPGEGPPA